jgi:carbamoyltransferase
MRLVRDRLQNAGHVQDVATTLGETLKLSRSDLRGKIHWVEHHPAHLASAFFVSPFEQAAVCAIDGFGDFVSTSWATGHDQSLRVRRRVYFPHSLGLLYLAITQYLGFPSYGDEYKVMGLAPYGVPLYVDALRQLLRDSARGSLTLDLSYFTHWRSGGQMTWKDQAPTIGPVCSRRVEELLGPARQPPEPITERHEAVAASLQVLFEDAVSQLLSAVYEETRLPALCLAGGCALNSVMNGKIRARTPFTQVYVQPAAGDNGTALGAALWLWHQVLGHPRAFVMEHAYWGPESTPEILSRVVNEQREVLHQHGCRIHNAESDTTLCRRTATLIAAGNVVGWFQGRMEWGARALGNRSILADPRRADMRDIINVKIKLRERFRPFAPSILEEALAEYFVDAVPDPFMLQVYPIRAEKQGVIPAVTHVDGSGRVQTVSRHANPLYWQLIRTFADITGVPVLLNTSFNENEPIVLRPEEALDCFLRTNMDVLVLGRYVIEKSTTPEVG